VNVETRIRYLVNNTNIEMYKSMLLENKRYICYTKTHGMESYTIAEIT